MTRHRMPILALIAVALAGVPSLSASLSGPPEPESDFTSLAGREYKPVQVLNVGFRCPSLRDVLVLSAERMVNHGNPALPAALRPAELQAPVVNGELIEPIVVWDAHGDPLYRPRSAPSEAAG